MKCVYLLLGVVLWMPLFSQVIDYSTVVKIEKGKRITERSLLIQINKPEERWLSEVEIPFSGDQQLDLLEASIISADGKAARNLKKQEIITRSDISHSAFFADDFVKAFSLSWNTYPYQIKYSYRITDRSFVYVANWHPVLHLNVPTLRASLRLEVPSEYKVASDFSSNLSHASDMIDGVQIHRWELNGFSAPGQEPFAPPLLELLPRVTVVPFDFQYAVVGSFASWSSYGLWHSKLNEHLDDLPASEANKVNDLIRGIEDKAEVIKTLYHYLQDNTRYINVAIDVGGLKPFPATYVCEKKYGDCKALTIYMKALLKQAGIPSFYTIVHAGENPVRIKKELPSQQFNHVILTVPINGDTIWLENTSNHLPFDYLGTFTQNRYALLIDGENSKLIRTPALEMEEVKEIRQYHVRLDEDGNGSVSINNALRGKGFEYYLLRKGELSEKDKWEMIQKDLKFNHFEPQHWAFETAGRDQKELELKMELKLRDQFRNIGSLKVIQPPLITIPAFGEPGNREHPLRINYPVNRQDSLVYDLPFLTAYQVEIPKDSLIATKYGKYETHYKVDGRRIVVFSKFQLFAGDYSLNDYPEFYSFIDAARSVQQQTAVILTKKL